MTISIKHATQAVGADAGNGEIRKAQWNESHTLQLDTDRLVGRTTAGTGAAEEISIDTSLSLTGGILSFSTTWGDARYALATAIPTAVSELTNDAGFITGYTVTQADVTTHQAALQITESQITDLGNYLTSETDPTVPAHVKGITTEQVTNWDTAYGWGNHAGLYSLTSHNHTLDGLSNVTITANASGEILKWSGTAWINSTLAEAGIAAASHNHDGTYEPVFTKNTAFNKNFGTAAGTVAQGNDSRINNGQTAYGWGNHASAGYALGTVTFTAGTGLTGGGTLAANRTFNVDVATATNLRAGTANKIVDAAGIYSANAPVTSSGTGSWAPDFNAGRVFDRTLTGASTLANPTNVTAGQSGHIYIVQDSTGGRTLAYGTNWKVPGGTAPEIDTTANAVNVFSYYARTTTHISLRYIGVES